MSKRSRTDAHDVPKKKERAPKHADVKPGPNMFKGAKQQFGPENKRVYTAVSSKQIVDAIDGTADPGATAPTLGAYSPIYAPTSTVNRFYLTSGIDNTGASNARSGKKIWLEAVAIRGMVTPIAAHGNFINRTSLFLVWVRHPNGSTTMPATSDILDSASCYAMNKLDNATDYRIIRRWDFKCGTGGTGGIMNPDSAHLVDEYVSLKKAEIAWKTTDTTGAWANLEEGGLFLMFLGDQNVASANYHMFQFSARLYYYSG